MPRKSLWMLLPPFLLLLSAVAVAQCLIYSANDYDSTTQEDNNSIFMAAICSGPSCPDTHVIWYYEGRGNPCIGIETANVTMSRFVLDTNNGIGMSFTVRGKYSGLLYRYGGLRYYCNGAPIYEDYPFESCLECDMYIPAACEHRPGSGSTYAGCDAFATCTNSCQERYPTVRIYAYDTCSYPLGGDHYCEAYAYSTYKSTGSAGVFGYAGVYFNGSPWCTGSNYRWCDGRVDEYFPQCGCIQPQ